MIFPMVLGIPHERVVLPQMGPHLQLRTSALEAKGCCASYPTEWALEPRTLSTTAQVHCAGFGEDNTST